MIPLDESAGETLVLRKRFACPMTEKSPSRGRFEKGNPAGSENQNNFRRQEEEYEKEKIISGTPAGGYLVGRHPECGMNTKDMAFLVTDEI